jgi:hypothetical protein
MLLFLLVFSNRIYAADIWLPKTNGFWHAGNNWSLSRPPDQTSGTTYITNIATNVLIKTVTLTASTPGTNMVINGLTLGSPTNGVTNILYLQDAGIDRPLTILNGSELKIFRGGALVLTNSSLLLTGGFSASQGFNVYAGTVKIESGSIQMLEDPGETNATTFVRIGRTNVGTLTINGGTMDVGSLRLGEGLAAVPQSKPTGNLLITGGLLKIGAEFGIANSPQSTGVVEVAGGTIQVANHGTNVMRIGDEGFGRMVISNGVVQVGDVSIARHTNALGALTIYTNGSFLGSDDISIGRFPGSTGVLFMAGGFLAATNHPLWIGREGNGRLDMSNGVLLASALHVAAVATNTAQGAVTLSGGSIVLSSNLLIGLAGYRSGQVLVSGGTLEVTNEAGLASTVVGNGSLEMTGGTASMDNLILTNGVGKIILKGGTLRTKGTIVSNGLPFQIGDGTNPATLFLLGGTHSFADGLIISSNAILAGCGIVTGPITTFGTNALNCQSQPPTITADPESQTVPQGTSIQFTGSASGSGPLFYQWLLNNSAIPGANGSVYQISAVQPSNAGSYRLMVTNTSGSATSAVAQLRVLVKPTVSQVTKAGGNVSLTFETINGLTYTVEFKDTLTMPSWSPLIPSTNGTGNPLTFQDINPATPTRFYRVRVD